MTLDRRQFVGASASLALAGCSRKTTTAPIAEPAEPGVVRIASVKTAVEGNVLTALIEPFERQSKYRVRVTTGTAVYDLARDGAADLVISHYGHKDAEAFVLDGIGEWPRTIFSNQMVLLGPSSDPARVRGLEDLGEAFERIAHTRSKFILNDIDGVHYLTEILWHAAGKPDRAGWMIDARASKDAAIEQASKLGGYALWGLTPFLRLDAASSLALEPLVLADPLLQRMLVSVVVKPSVVGTVNRTGALAFQSYLLAPSTQAAIRTIRYPGKQIVSWVPAGRHNRSTFLPES